MSGPWTERPADDAAYWVARGIAELKAFGAFNRTVANTLLPYWRHAHHLNAGDWRAVLDWFSAEAEVADDEDPGERATVGPPMQAPGLAMRWRKA